MCNNTGSRVGVAIGYKDAEDWTTEGWWNLPSHTCETMLKGNLAARYYYVYAVDYDHGGEWMGQGYLCTRDRTFTIRGTNDCLARGYDRTRFFEVDTSGEQRAWTVQLIEIIGDLVRDWAHLDERIESVTNEIEGLARTDVSCGRLMTVPGIGPTATEPALQKGATLPPG
jgi:uncharacterized membrane protein